MITIFTDGGCSPNPGPGSWAFLAKDMEAGEEPVELGRCWGFAPQTTNNRMEITAAIQGLTVLRGMLGPDYPITDITVTTDSGYLVLGASKWLQGWKRKGWKLRKHHGAAGDVKNRDLWEILDGLTTPFTKWTHVRGHAGHPENEICDQLCVQELKLRRGEM
jgi:ribonuclease HI